MRETVSIRVIERPKTGTEAVRRPELLDALLKTVTSGKAVEIDPRAHAFADAQSVRHSLQVTLNRRGLSFHCRKTGTKDGLLILWATKKD